MNKTPIIKQSSFGELHDKAVENLEISLPDIEQAAAWLNGGAADFMRVDLRSATSGFDSHMVMRLLSMVNAKRADGVAALIEVERGKSDFMTECDRRYEQMKETPPMDILLKDAAQKRQWDEKAKKTRDKVAISLFNKNGSARKKTNPRSNYTDEYNTKAAMTYAEIVNYGINGTIEVAEKMRGLLTMHFMNHPMDDVLKDCIGQLNTDITRRSRPMRANEFKIGNVNELTNVNAHTVTATTDLFNSVQPRLTGNMNKLKLR